MNDHEIQELLELAESEGLPLPWPPEHVFNEEDESELIALLTNEEKPTRTYTRKREQPVNS